MIGRELEGSCRDPDTSQHLKVAAFMSISL